MPRLKLTEKTIAKLPAPTASRRQVLYWDDGRNAVRGFGVLCSGKTTSRTYVAQRDMPDGRARRVTIGGVTEITLPEARDRAAKIVNELREGRDPKAKRAAGTLREILEDHRAARKEKLRARSVELYGAIDRYLADWMNWPLHQITSAKVEMRHREIASEVEQRHREKNAEFAAKYRARAVQAEKRGWPDAAERWRAKAVEAEGRAVPGGGPTANAAMRALRLVWNFAAYRNPELGPNPVKLRDRWFDVPRRERHVRADELPRFYEAVIALENRVARDYLLFLLFTGLRRREAAGLRWEDVDLQNRVITIPAARNKSRRKLDLPLTDLVRDLLVARRAMGDGQFIFPGNSKSGHIEEPKFFFDQIAEVTGIRVSAHDLRRTYITTASRTEITGRDLKALVNHSLGTDVTAGYDQVTVADLREPAQKVCDRLKTLCGTEPISGETVTALSARLR